MALLEVRNLEVKFPLRQREFIALRDISFSLERGDRLGIVGESGAGKSVTAFALLNLIARPGYISDGEILFEGRDLTRLNAEQLRTVRGNRISMIFQDPMMTLNPVMTIGTQMMECLKAHKRLPYSQARKLAIENLYRVHIPSPELCFNQYPHALSGGMRQRVIIAIALLTNPTIIIADEPTTALDVTIQAEIMTLLVELCENADLSLILITHDLGVIAQTTLRTIVMYAGRIVEEANTIQILDNPQHPYTRGLIDALPERANADGSLNQIPGVMPALTAVPSGCAFHPRCAHVLENCSEQIPFYTWLKESRVACHWIARNAG